MDETIYKRSLKGKEISHGSQTNRFRLSVRDRVFDMGRRIRIGRDKKNDVVISDDPLVSRRHAIIELRGGQYYLQDLGSTNQTYLNNKPVSQQSWAVIRNGDVITIGHTRIEVSQL